jgi:predicted Zn-dependent peptidase
MTVRVTRLESGLRVVTHEMNHLESAALGIWIGAGSRSEGDSEHGLSHLLEHMAFKGTRTRSAIDIAEEIEAVGGEVNAATSVETTSYYARVLKDDVPLALDILSDILRNSVFDPAEPASSTSSCRRSAPRSTRPRTGSSTSSRRAPSPTSRSGARSSARRRR